MHNHNDLDYEYQYEASASGMTLTITITIRITTLITGWSDCFSHVNEVIVALTVTLR